MIFSLSCFKRHHQDIIRHPVITSSNFGGKNGESHFYGENQITVNVVGHSTNGTHSYPDGQQLTGRTNATASNKVVFLNTPPPPPKHQQLKIEMHRTSKRAKQLSIVYRLKHFGFKSNIAYVADSFRKFYFSLFDTLLPRFIIKPRLFWITALGSLAAAAAFIIFYFPGLRLPDKEEFQLFKANHIFER